MHPSRCQAELRQLPGHQPPPPRYPRGVQRQAEGHGRGRPGGGFLRERGGGSIPDKPLYYTVPASSAEKPFTISEVLELGPGKLPAETLIRSEAVANVQDCKMMPGKVILKGEVLLCTLYANDTVAGTMDRVEHEIPFSQIVDVDGLDEEWFCDCRADVTVCDVHITQNPNGENVLLSVSIKLQAQVQCYRTGASEIITDAYLTSCPLKLDTRRVETQQLLGIRKRRLPGQGDARTAARGSGRDRRHVV